MTRRLIAGVAACALGLGGGCGAAADPAPEPAARLEAEPPAVAEPLPDLALTLADGERSSLRAQLGEGRALVIAYTSLACPVSRLYAPSWEALRAGWAEQGVALLLVDPMQVDDDAEVCAAAEELGWRAPVARDPSGALTEALDARRTTDVFLVDTALRVRYRGARDDQYGIGTRLAAPRRRYLEDALAALLAGRPIEVAATEAPG